MRKIPEVLSLRFDCGLSTAPLSHEPRRAMPACSDSGAAFAEVLNGVPRGLSLQLVLRPLLSFAGRLNVVKRQEHSAGEKLFVAMFAAFS